MTVTESLVSVREIKRNRSAADSAQANIGALQISEVCVLRPSNNLSD